jgi:hypothetical protein
MTLRTRRTRWTSTALGVSLALVASATGCSGPNGEEASPGDTVTLTPSDPNSDTTGTVGLQLSLPSGQQIPVISWSITGPNGAATVVQSGTAKSQSIGVTFLIGNIPAGSGYQVSLSGTSSDGSVICAGTASFSIVARMTTPVVVELACSTATSGSHVTLVNGDTFNCAAWANVSASPTTTTVGSSVNLSATATAPSPSALTFNWSAPGGTFGNRTAANTTFTCTAAGTVNVTLVVGDGPVPAGQSCDPSLTTRTIPIQCQPSTQSDAGSDAGAADGGPPPPPPAAPAVPPWSFGSLVLALAALGSVAARRRDKELR